MIQYVASQNSCPSLCHSLVRTLSMVKQRKITLLTLILAVHISRTRHSMRLNLRFRRFWKSVRTKSIPSPNRGATHSTSGRSQIVPGLCYGCVRAVSRSRDWFPSKLGTCGRTACLPMSPSANTAYRPTKQRARPGRTARAKVM